MKRALIGAALLLAVVASHGRAAAQPDWVEYTVREGDTCAAIARRTYGSARRYDLIHRLNPDMGPTPHRLRAGTVLRLPRAGADTAGADARLTAVHRSVRARPPRGEGWRPARAGQDLGRGHQVVTDEASSAEVRFRDDSVVQMREHTLVIIYGGSRRLARRTTSATLERGALRSRLDELAGSLAVSTPSSEAEVHGGQAIVTVAGDGTSRVVNLEGRPATVTGGSVSVSVPPGTGTVVRRDSRPTPPRPLPQPPRWANDLAGRFVGLTGRGGTLRGSWVPIEAAAAYRVEVAQRPDGDDVVAAAVVSGEVHDFEIHGIPYGTYYLSVASIDRDGLEGRPSPRRAMSVMEARIIQPGGGEPRTEPYDPGDPSRPWGPPTVLPGTWIVAPVGLRCGGGVTEPRGMATLRETGLRTVRCIDARDREIPAFDVDVVPVRIRVTGGIRPLRRRAESTLELLLSTDMELPGTLIPRVTGGLTITRVVRRGERLTVAVRAHADAPDAGRLDVGVLAGTEHIPIAAIDLSVVDGVRFAPLPLPPPLPVRPARPPAYVFPALPMPEVLPLDDPSPRGVQAFVALGALDGVDRTRVRATAGARAQIFDEPLRLGFMWSLDIDGSTATEPEDGNADLWLSAAWDVTSDPRWDLAIEAATWVPTSATATGLAVPRLSPSLHLAYKPVDSFALRTRQGLMVDAARDGVRLWAWAAGLEFYPLDLVGLSAEFVGSFGRGAAGDSVALAVGVSGSFRLSVMEAGLGVRASLNEDGNASMGRWAAVATLRIAFADL